MEIPQLFPRSSFNEIIKNPIKALTFSKALSYNAQTMAKKYLRGGCLLVLFLSLMISGCGTTGKKTAHKYKYKASHGFAKVSSGAQIKLEMNDRVRTWIDYFTGPGRDRFGRYLQRSGRYVPLMKEILAEHGLPEDVIYIAMIESGFTANARSYASAVGFWQFIGSTGRRYDLRIDPYVDDRIHFEKATHAAANYLADLYNMFGDWYLAFAAYNAGEGKIGRAIDMYGTKDFWQLSAPKNKYLRPETKDYVPKFIAAAIIAKNPKKYGFASVPYEQPLEYEKVKVTHQTDVDVIAKCSKTDYETITLLNPQLLMGITPPGENYEIHLPTGKSQKFLTAFAKLDPDERLTRRVDIASTSGTYIVKKGDTVAKVAKKYKVSVKSLLAANDLRGRKIHLKAGQALKIPGLVATSTTAVASKSSGSEKPRSIVAKPTSYKVMRGDTLASISDKFNVPVDSIKNMNKIRGNKIIPGMKLKIMPTSEAVAKVETSSTPAVEQAESKVNSKASIVPAAPKKERSSKPSSGAYKVRGGDTLYAIAAKNKMSVAEIAALNNMSRSSTLKAGMTLKLSKPADMASAVDEAVSETPELASESVQTTTPPVVRAPKVEPKAKSVKAPAKTMITKTTKKEIITKKQQAGSAVPAKAQNSAGKYKVKAGDTAWSIAKRNNVSVEELKAMNGGKDISKVRPGQTLKLKAK